MRGKRIADLDIISVVNTTDFLVIETPSGTFRISTDDVRLWMKNKLLPDFQMEIPSIINDCVTGGENSTLSAEQGKILMKKIEDIIENIGDEVLTTDAQTIKGAINELNNIDYSADKIIYTHQTHPEIENVKDALDFLLYKKPTIIMTASSPLINEIGSTINNVSIIWSYNPNIIESQSLDGHELAVDERAKVYPSINSNKTIKLVAKDKYNTLNSSITFSFYNGVYYGTSGSSVEISRLNKIIRADRFTTFTVNVPEGNFVYFALPTRYGKPSFYVGGFEGGFTKVRTESYTNPSGYSENYDIYRSVQDGLGSTSVTIK